MTKIKEGESLLNEEELDLEQRATNQSGVAGKSLLSSKSKDAIVADFFKSMGKGGGNIFEVDAYLVCEREEALRNILALRTVKGFTINPIKITSFEVESEYICINKILNIPIDNQKLNKYPAYLYDEEAAQKLVHNLNLSAYNAICEERDHFIKCATFLENVVNKSLY